MLDVKIKDLLNQQINKEFYSAYLYLAFSNYFSERNLSGFSNWYRIQAQEERDHAMLFLQYLENNSETVVLEAVDRPEQDFQGDMAVLEKGLQHERYVTDLIHTIYDAAYSVKDFRTMQFLDCQRAGRGREECRGPLKEDGIVWRGPEVSVFARPGVGSAHICSAIFGPIRLLLRKLPAYVGASFFILTCYANRIFAEK